MSVEPTSKRPFLSLCMIVRDAAPTLEACLSSIVPWVDDVVVVDTGSRDATMEIAVRHGARLFHFPWVDHFAAARNESLRHARGKWIFWLDADDVIPAEHGAKLRALAEREWDDSILGHVMTVYYPTAGRRGEKLAVHQVKLVRNRRDIYFEGRIHEQLLPSIRRLGGELHRTDVVVEHAGADISEAGLAKKFARDLRLLKLQLAEYPEDSFAHYNLGMTLTCMSRWDEAIAAVRESVRLLDAPAPHIRKAFGLWVHCLDRTGRHQEARSVCAEGQRRFPDDVELWFHRGRLAAALGEPAEAEQCYRRVLETRETNYLMNLDPGISGFKTHFNLGRLYQDLGRLEEAEAAYRASAADRADYAPAWEGLARLYLASEKWTSAAALAEEMLTLAPGAPQAYLLAAAAELGRGEFDAASRQLLLIGDPMSLDQAALGDYARLGIACLRRKASVQSTAEHRQEPAADADVEGSMSLLALIELWEPVARERANLLNEALNSYALQDEPRFQHMLQGLADDFPDLLGPKVTLAVSTLAKRVERSSNSAAVLY